MYGPKMPFPQVFQEQQGDIFLATARGYKKQLEAANFNFTSYAGVPWASLSVTQGKTRKACDGLYFSSGEITLL